MTKRKMMTEQVKTTCPYCGVGCGLLVQQQDGDIRIQGDPQHPSNFGRLCSKGAALAETIDLDGRLLNPRLHGRESDWDEALQAVADGFGKIIREHGPDAVAFYVSGQLLTEDYYVANKLMKGFIGSANIDTNSRLCMSSAVASYKRAFGTDSVPCSYEDLERAKLIVLTGSNTAWCHPVLFQRIVKAKQDNPDLQVVVIDPRRTATCDIADLHLPLQPGSDAVLFNGLLAYLEQHGELNEAFTSQHCEGVEEALTAARQSATNIQHISSICHLPEQDLERFYRLFARSERVVTLYSQGINQSSSGTDKGNAIINCHLYTGRIGRPGMGPFSITGQPNAMGGREVGGLSNQLAAHMELENPEHRARVQQFWQSPKMASQAGLKAVDMFEAVARGEVKAVWIMGTNPVVSMPEANRVRAALQQCELLVVSDCMARTDTVDLAHIQLPALAWGEKSGTVTNSERRISRQRDFLPAPGQARADWWIISEVAKRMGYGEAFHYPGEAQIFREHAQLTACNNQNQTSRDLNLEGISELDTHEYEQLEPVQWPVTRAGGTTRLFGDGRFYTPSGKARMIAVSPLPPARAADARYPLVLNTGRVRDHWHTMTRSGKSPRLATHIQEPYVEIHPQDAGVRHLQENALVQVRNLHGYITVRARISETVRPGQVFIPIHWNDQYSHNARVDSLVAAITDPRSGQPEFKQNPVQVQAYPARWYGFILSRRELNPCTVGYWSKSRGCGLWRYPIAGDETQPDWTGHAPQLLGGEDGKGDWIEYYDAAAHRYRAARMVNGQLDSCLYIGPGPQLPAHDWLETLFDKPQLDEKERMALLSGKPPSKQDDAGPTVCACYGVGKNVLRKAIKEQGLDSVEAIGKALKAGTNCGSCVPEIREMFKEDLVEKNDLLHEKQARI